MATSIIPYDQWIAEYVIANTPPSLTYTFIIDGETSRRTPIEYLADPEMQRMVSPSSKRVMMPALYLGHTVFALSIEAYNDDPTMKELYQYYKRELELNPIRFFAPSGIQALAFMNDVESDIKLLRAPNRCGKTAHGVLDVVIDTVPLPEHWEIFTEHGVTYRPWKGPIEVGAASYTSRSLRKSVWTEFMKWVPNDQLGDYKVNENGKRKRSWNPQDPHIAFDCGSTLMCHTYNQSGESAVGAVYKRFLFDEQPPQFFFDEINERLGTVLGRGVISATPHKVEGRPDTGAGQLMEKMETGELKMGLDIATYAMQVGDVPDWVYPNASKAKKYSKWIIEPQMTNNIKALRAGRSRFLGEYEEGSGLVFDEWDRRVHIIEEGMVKITDDMTRYRAIDHGVNNPTACLYAAVDHHFNIFIYDEYYERDRTIYENVKGIIEKAGNTRKLFDTFHDTSNGATIERYEEAEHRARFAATVMDGRSFAKKLDSSRMTIGAMYKAAGLVRVKPASGAQQKDTIPIVKEFLRVDQNRKHVLTGELGAPRIYIMDNCKHFIREIGSYVWMTTSGRVDTANPGEKPREKDDHLMDALKYLCQIPPRYMGSVLPGDRLGGRDAAEIKPRTRKKVRDGRTGY